MKDIRVRPAPCRIPLGHAVATPSALAAVAHEELLHALAAHASGDWGLVDAEDAAANENALRHGDRLLSAYETAAGIRFWLITEADRSVTTALLPEEY